MLRIVDLRQPAIAAASARRQLVGAQARQDAVLPNPAIEWRREGSAGGLTTDAFLTVSQPIDVTGRRLALRSAASAMDRRGLADSATVTRAAEAAAIRAYWRASLAKALLAIAAEHRSDAARLATTDSLRACEGAIAEGAAMRAALEADRARLAEAGAMAEWMRARGELASALATPIDSLPDVPALTAARAGLTLAPTVDATLATARGARSELASARAAQDAARLRERAVTLGILGDVALQAGNKRSGTQNMSVVGLALPFPLWNQNGAARAAAAAERRLADTESRAVDLSVVTDVTAAVESYRALTDARLPSADNLVARATEMARIAEAAYEAGGATLIELLDARRARSDALTALLRWSAELHLAQLEIVRAAGQPFTDLLETR